MGNKCLNLHVSLGNIVSLTEPSNRTSSIIFTPLLRHSPRSRKPADKSLYEALQETSKSTMCLCNCRILSSTDGHLLKSLLWILITCILKSIKMQIVVCTNLGTL